MKDKYFITFGFDSPLRNTYMIIHSDYETAREIACNGFKYWANIYSEGEWIDENEVPMSDKYNLLLLCEIESRDSKSVAEVWR